MALAAIITVRVFNALFAKNTVDYFSFAVALFLVGDEIYRIVRYRKETYLPSQLMRHARIIIGVCVFTIHLMQRVYSI